MFIENKTEVSEFYTYCLVISTSVRITFMEHFFQVSLANDFDLLDSQPIFVCDLRISGSHI